jgi:hypothetical protein
LSVPATPEALDARYPRNDLPVSALLRDSGGNFPITTVEITLRLRQFGIDFGPKRTEILTNTLTHGWFAHSAVGMQIGTSGPVNPLGAFIRRVQAQSLGLRVE